MNPNETLLWSGSPKTRFFIPIRNARYVVGSCAFLAFLLLAIWSSWDKSEQVTSGLLQVLGLFFASFIFIAFNRPSWVYEITDQRIITHRRGFRPESHELPLEKLCEMRLYKFRDTGTLELYFLDRTEERDGFIATIERIADAERVQGIIKTARDRFPPPA